MNRSQKVSLGGGDIAASLTEDDIAVADRRFNEAQPETRTVGDLHPYRTPADRSVQPGVGNVALMIGNWGMRRENGKRSGVANREAHDRQVLGSPAMIIVLFEATNAVAAMLEQPPQHVENRPQSRQTGAAPAGTVSMRDWYGHHVIIGQDAKQPVLMPARKNNCSGIECHTYNPWIDGDLNINQQQKSPPPKSWRARSIGSRTSGIWATRFE